MADLIPLLQIAGNGSMVIVAMFLAVHNVKIKNLEREVFK